MVKLDIGSGVSPIGNGFIEVDPYMETAVVKANMWELPYEDNSVDEIFSSHALEHIPQKMVIPTLKEWYRILVPNGKIVLRVPDLAWCCKFFLEHQHEGWALAIIFGNQNHDGEFHLTGFWKEYLIRLVQEAKFKITKYEELFTHEQNTLSIELTK